MNNILIIIHRAIVHYKIKIFLHNFKQINYQIYKIVFNQIFLIFKIIIIKNKTSKE